MLQQIRAISAKTSGHNWKPGTAGKGLVDQDGQIHTWTIDHSGAPHHMTKGLRHNWVPSTQVPAQLKGFMIEPDGTVNTWHHELENTPGLKKDEDKWYFSTHVFGDEGLPVEGWVDSAKGSDPFDDKEWEKIKKKIKWQQGLGQELEQGQIAPNTTLPSGFDQHIQANWNFSSVKQSSIEIHRYPKSDTSFDPQAQDSRPVVVEKESGDIHIGPKNSFHNALLTWLALSWTDISVDGRINYDDDNDTAEVAIEENHQGYGEFITKWMQAEEPYITFKTIGKDNWSFSAVRPKRINDNKDPFDLVTPEELRPWQPGEYGKFIGTPDQVHTWTNQANPYYDDENTVFDGWPAHQAVADALGLGPMYTENWDSNYTAGHISPDGALSVLDDLHNTVDKMIQQDPRLHEDEGWTFSKVAQSRFGSFDLDEFDPLSDDDYMGEDFDDQAIKDLLRQGIRGGRSGKGLKLPDGNFVYWEADVHGAPHHMEVLQTLRVRDSRQVEFLMVSREGDVKNEADFDNQEWEFE